MLNNLKQSGTYSESEDEDSPKHEVCLNPACDTRHNADLPPAARRGDFHSDDADADADEANKVHITLSFVTSHSNLSLLIENLKSLRSFCWLYQELLREAWRGPC